MAVSIQGNVALVTGANGGIGRAIALMLAEQGCNLALLARNKDELNETARLCAEHGVKALPISVDLTDTAALAAAIWQSAETLGGLHILVNNAGLFDWASAAEADLETWDRLLDVNLRATMHATRLALPYIKQQPRGAVIFIASRAGKFAFGMNAAYVASKHGMVGFAGSVFEDVRNHNIKVCAICPGFVNAGASLTMDAEADTFAKFIQPEDVADAARFVLTFSDTACPTEIILNTQRDPWSND
jgi:NADP-dependent 3-hydroxy acid dehydrogenase YdfG